MVTQEFIDEVKQRHGEGSNEYRVNVLGLPPLSDSDALVPYDWIQDAIDREIEPIDEDPVVMGVDPGAGGDNSVMVVRKGGKVHDEIFRLRTDKSDVFLGWVGAKIDEFKPDLVMVDNIGIGWGVPDQLRKQKNCQIVGVDVRSRSTQPEKYGNLRAEGAWLLREQFEMAQIDIPNDARLKKQIEVMKFEYGKPTRLLAKTRIREIIGQSPDEFDALMLTYMRDSVLISRFRKKGKKTRTRPYGSFSWMGA